MERDVLRITDGKEILRLHKYTPEHMVQARNQHHVICLEYARFGASPVLRAACGAFAEGTSDKVLQKGRTFALASPMATSYYHK